MTKKEITSMTTAQLIWEFGLRATNDPMPTKQSKKDVDNMMRELDARGIVKYDDMVTQGTKMYFL